LCSFIAPGGRHTQQRTLSKWLTSAVETQPSKNTRYSPVLVARVVSYDEKMVDCAKTPPNFISFKLPAG